MRISEVVRHKGDNVVTVKPDDTVLQLLATLDEHRIGAVVVSGDGGSVDGIVSERDIVRHLHTTGPELLEAPVSSIMSSDVATCDPHTDIGEVERLMTEKRVRHVPVVVDGRLRGIVSIGDVVKNRIEALQSERDQLVGYIQQ